MLAARDAPGLDRPKSVTVAAASGGSTTDRDFLEASDDETFAAAKLNGLDGEREAREALGISDPVSPMRSLSSRR